jgi:hypothetical protein
VAPVTQKLDLRLNDDRAAFLEILAEKGIRLLEDALEFASTKLPEDWLVLFPMDIFNIRTSRAGTYALGIRVWVEVAQGLYNLRSTPGIDEQIRRLGIVSHEALDTSLVLQIAGRYAAAGFSVAFEPNGKGCSDLLVENAILRLYIEVKRENQQDHKHFESIRRCSGEILAALQPQPRDWLEDKELRLEIRFPRTFSSESVIAITREIKQIVLQSEPGKEISLSAIRGSRCFLTESHEEPHFKKGIRQGLIRIKQPGVPVQLSPQNMPVLVSFESNMNTTALRARLQKASRQLKADAIRDPGAVGFFVMEVFRGEDAKDIIAKRYLSSFPTNCLGIVLLSNSGWLIPASGVSQDVCDVMALAAR